MEIVSTFVQVKGKGIPKLWTVCYPEDSQDDSNIDVFNKIFNQWNDTKYLQEFFLKNQNDLRRPIWEGISIDEAIDQVLNEAEAFEIELKGIELQLPGYENATFGDIFHQFHKNEFFLIKKNEQRFRKGRPDFQNPMLRLYALELEGGCFVVTGGAIKLVHKMEDSPELGAEIARLKRVEDFLRREGINSIESLL